MTRADLRGKCEQIISSGSDDEAFAAARCLRLLGVDHYDEKKIRNFQVSDSGDFANYLLLTGERRCLDKLRLTDPAVLAVLPDHLIEGEIVSLASNFQFLLDPATHAAIGGFFGRSDNFPWLTECLEFPVTRDFSISRLVAINPLPAYESEVLEKLESHDDEDLLLFWQILLPHASASFCIDKLQNLNIHAALNACMSALEDHEIPEKLKDVFGKRNDAAAAVMLFENFAENSLPWLACRVFARLLKQCPAAVANWQETSSKRFKAKSESLCRMGFSLAVISSELGSSLSQLSTGDATVRVQFSRSARQLVCFFKQSELEAELMMIFPDVWPLRVASVEASPIPGISKTRNRHTAMAVQVSLTCSTIDKAVAAWSKSISAVLEGIEECYICYSVVHVESNSLPSKQCGTCKNKYHSDCIFRWFRTSHKTTCPICQTPF